MPHAKLKKPKPEVEAGRPWWEFEGFEKLPETEREGYRSEAVYFESLNAEERSNAIIRARKSVNEYKAFAKQAFDEYRWCRRFYEAARERLRSASAGDGGATATAIAAGSGHRPDSAA